MHDPYETEHLSVDYLGVVWFGHIQLGLLSDDPAWPAHKLGLEPDWFADEMQELHAQDDDAQRNDYRPDAAEAFRRANERLAR